ncbi:MAG TPA: rod shape-determining protein MreD [Actinomycetota bacterium]|jgi:rod shape-determining protein MreD|nr:rod shape-determining protein MreD [Actinomycetota bacterium]
MARETRRPGVLSELGITRSAAIAVVIVIALALQSTLLTRATLLGVIPQVLLVAVVSLAYLDGEYVGASTGFFGGLLQDLLIAGSITGLYALVYTLVGYTVGSFRRFTSSSSVWMPVVVVMVSSAAAELGYAMLNILMGQRWVGLEDTAKVAGLVILYNTLLTPFVFPLVRRVADRYRPERVHQW